MGKKKVFQALAGYLTARWNCISNLDKAPQGSDEAKHWQEMVAKHEECVRAIEKQHLPHGSGFDSGTGVDIAACTVGRKAHSGPEKIVLVVEFHHMDENGMYCGWSHHRVSVVPSLLFEFDLVWAHGGWPDEGEGDHDAWTDYAHEVLREALNTVIED